MKSKKWLSLLLGVTLLMGSQNIIAKEIVVNIDHVQLQLEQPIIMEKGITYIPVRAISEALGAKVSWYENTVSLTVEDTLYVECEIGSNKARTNFYDEEVILDGPARMHKGAIYVPLRFVSEALGAEVNYQSGKIEIDSSGISKKVAHEQEAELIRQTEANDHFTYSDRYDGEGTYDAASNTWGYIVCDREHAVGVLGTVLYNVAHDKWYRFDEDSAMSESVYQKTFLPGCIQYDRDYKNSTLSEDFEYQYKDERSNEVYFYVILSDQRDKYYTAWTLFKMDLSTKKITFVSNPYDEESPDIDLDQYTWLGQDVQEAAEPKMPAFPKDLDMDQLPVSSLSLKTVYHAQLSVGGKKMNSLFAYERDGADFVILKDVQQLDSKVAFNQDGKGVRSLSYGGKKVVLSKNDYCVTAGGNRVMVSTKVLKDLGLDVIVNYI